MWSSAEEPTWLDLWLRPSCWMALSALQGSSHVKWTRRLWFEASALACREMPVLAASATMATSFSPFMNAAATRDRASRCTRNQTRISPIRLGKPEHASRDP